MKRRVVITGLGSVSSLGNNLPETWSALLAGNSGIASSPVSGAKVFGTIKDFNPKPYYKRCGLAKSLTAAYGFSACDEAIADAGISKEELPEVGLIFANGNVSTHDIEKSIAKAHKTGTVANLDRTICFRILGNLPRGAISIDLGM